MRLIDGDALMETINRHCYPIRHDMTSIEPGMTRIGILQAIQEQPTIEPERTGKWIPCSERLPEERDAGILKKLGTSKRSDDVLITVDVKGERMTDVGCTYDGVWQWIHKHAFPDWAVIAWMPLPEPYEEVAT